MDAILHDEDEKTCMRVANRGRNYQKQRKKDWKI